MPAAARDWGEAVLLCTFAPNAGDNFGPRVHERVKVTGGKGKKTMYLVDDKNKNRQVDDGEAISGTKVTLRDPVSGAELCRIELPASNVTDCAFGGEDLCTLYISTARSGLTAAQLEAEPLAGGLFAVRIGSPGLLAAEFGG